MKSKRAKKDKGSGSGTSQRSKKKTEKSEPFYFGKLKRIRIGNMTAVYGFFSF